MRLCSCLRHYRGRYWEWTWIKAWQFITLVFSIILALGETNEPLCIQKKKERFSSIKINKHKFKAARLEIQMMLSVHARLVPFGVLTKWKSAEIQIFTLQLCGKHHFSAQIFWLFPEFMPIYHFSQGTEMSSRKRQLLKTKRSTFKSPSISLGDIKEILKF